MESTRGGVAAVTIELQTPAGESWIAVQKFGCSVLVIQTPTRKPTIQTPESASFDLPVVRLG